MSGITKEKQLSMLYHYIHNTDTSLHGCIHVSKFLVLGLSSLLLLISISPAPVTPPCPPKPHLHRNSFLSLPTVELIPEVQTGTAPPTALPNGCQPLTTWVKPLALRSSTSYLIIMHLLRHLELAKTQLYSDQWI